MAKNFYQKLIYFCKKHDLVLADSNRRVVTESDFNQCGFTLMTTKTSHPTLNDLGLRNSDQKAKTPRRQVVCACAKWDGHSLDIEINPLFKELSSLFADEFRGKISGEITHLANRWEAIGDSGEGDFFSGG